MSNNNDNILTIKKRGEDGNRLITVRIKVETLNRLDEIAAESNYSRNELINIILDLVGNDTGTIVVNLVDLVVGHMRHKLVLDAGDHFLFSHQQSIHSGRKNLSDLLVSIKQTPINLGGAAISN